MKLTLHRTGGFAGSVGAPTFVLDPDKLPEPRRASLLALLSTAQVFEQPAMQRLAAPHAWDFLYSLQLADGSHSHTVELHLAAVDSALRNLVLFLEGESLQASGAQG
jgi:hypothetical protein